MKNVLKLFVALSFTLSLSPMFAARPFVDRTSIINTVQSPVNDAILEQVNEQEYEKNKNSELAKIEQSIAKISVGSVYTINIRNISDWRNNTEIQSALAEWKEACNEKAKKPAHAKELSGEDDVETISVKCVIKTCDDGYTRTDNNTKCTKETKVETPTNSGSNPDNGNTQQQTETTPTDTRTDEEKAQALAEKKQAFDDAKATEQSKANRTLTAATTAATGVGGMELAQGLSEQNADREAEQNMAAYISTMRCSYGSGKSVKAGTEEIELPGGNSANLMQYRSEYVALASDLKERKNALGMKPGIESEEILDKSQMGLYDDENVGIDSGAYSSLYRTQMYNSESDKEQIDAAKQESKNRVIGGAVAAGAGVVGGMVGDSLINGKLGELIKQRSDNKNIDTTETISILDKNTIIKTLTNEDIKQIVQEQGLQ